MSDIPDKILHPWEDSQKMKRRQRKLLLLILAILLAFGIYYYRDEISEIFANASSNFDSIGTQISESMQQKPQINITQMEIEIHDLINQERIKNGLSSMSWNQELASIAREHSKDMATRHYFSHDDLEGRDFNYRYNNADFRCSVPTGKGYFALGAENIFQNNLYDSITYINGVPVYNWNTQQEIAESTVRGWMSSEGHKENILTPYWKSEGIGIAISDDDKVYITEDFC
jgi:uncharacterized protein YkwD